MKYEFPKVPEFPDVPPDEPEEEYLVPVKARIASLPPVLQGREIVDYLMTLRGGVVQ